MRLAFWMVLMFSGHCANEIFKDMFWKICWKGNLHFKNNNHNHVKMVKKKICWYNFSKNSMSLICENEFSWESLNGFQLRQPPLWVPSFKLKKWQQIGKPWSDSLHLQQACPYANVEQMDRYMVPSPRDSWRLWGQMKTGNVLEQHVTNQRCVPCAHFLVRVRKYLCWLVTELV